MRNCTKLFPVKATGKKAVGLLTSGGSLLHKHIYSNEIFDAAKDMWKYLGYGEIKNMILFIMPGEF